MGGEGGGERFVQYKSTAGEKKHGKAFWSTGHPPSRSIEIVQRPPSQMWSSNPSAPPPPSPNPSPPPLSSLTTLSIVGPFCMPSFPTRKSIYSPSALPRCSPMRYGYHYHGWEVQFKVSCFGKLKHCSCKSCNVNSLYPVVLLGIRGRWRTGGRAGGFYTSTFERIMSLCPKPGDGKVRNYF